MKREILSRYARTPDGVVIIDVAASRIEDLYSNFDKNVPYLKKDLDTDLADYLTECAREIGKTEFMIRISLTHASTSTPVSRIRNSIESYFLYVRDVERRNLRKMMRTSALLLIVGLSILGLAVWVNQFMAGRTGVMEKVFAEGLTIAAWVSLWEALATFLVQWPPHRQEIRLCERLANAPVYVAVKWTSE